MIIVRLGYPAKIDFSGFFLYGMVGCTYGPVKFEIFFVERLEISYIRTDVPKYVK